jgi:carbonic anhydrase/acetyltransferase-like protein (isoleucine patch superfamily)
VNATDTTATEPVTAPAGTTAPGSPPGTGQRAGPLTIRHRGVAPSVHPDAYVAPSAVLSGQVSVGAGSCIMHGAVLAAQGGPVQVGAGWVIMENAVPRGTVPHPLRIGDRVLAGPHTQLTGCTIADEAFIAAGAIVAPQARIPAGWVAVGDPARAYPPGQAEAISAGLAETGWSFLPFIFGIDDAGGRRDQLCTALARYTAAMAHYHHQDQVLCGFSR